VRSYRVSRITHAEVLNEHAEIPADFDLATFWQQSATVFKTNVPNYVAQFWVAPEVLLRLSFAGRFARVTETDETDARGWRKVVVGFDVEEMACEYAVSFGPNLESHRTAIAPRESYRHGPCHTTVLQKSIHRLHR
jgi:predicted DNA-binding transcriptional regulator YafY